MNFYDYTVSSPFGYRGDIGVAGASKNHKGTDYAIPSGTTLKSNVSGTVTESQYSNSYGHYVTVTAPDGTKHKYAHLSSRGVSVGDLVTVDDVLGVTGSTGISSGPHLHYEVIGSDGNYLDSHAYATSGATGGEVSTTVTTTGADYDFWDKEFWLNIVGTLLKIIVIIGVAVVMVLVLMSALDIDGGFSFI